MILAELHIKREIIKTCQNAINQVYENDEITEIYGKATSSLDLVFDIKNMDAVYLGKVMENRINDLSKLEKGKITGIMTGISNLDNSFGGWQNGDMIVIAARPSMGKTAISLYFSKIAVMQQNKRLLYFSLEMPSYRLADRILSLETGINSELLQNGRIQDKEWLTLYEVADKYNNSSFVINDQAGLTIEQIIAMSIIENRKAKLDMIVIDYMQLIGYTFKDKRTTNDQVSHISKNVKKLAKMLNIPVIALAQLNRDCEKRSDKRPELSDLRDSGSIEQDADVVAFLYRDEHYNTESEAINIIEVIFRKNRNGRIGTEFLHKSNDWSYISDKALTIWSENMPEF
jgi:replicative DNA helicase